mgnify:FL=1
MENTGHIEQLTAEVIRRYFRKTGFWKRSPENQEEMLNRCLDELNSLWSTNFTLTCNFGNEERYHSTGGGTAGFLGMVLYKSSLMTFLHEFYHLLAKDNVVKESNSERNAIKWSHAIFKMALPVLYRKGVEEGKFFHSVVVGGE